MAFIRELFHADLEISRMRTHYRTIEVGDKSDGSTKKLEVQVTTSPAHVEITPADAGNNDRHVISFFLKEVASVEAIGDIPVKIVVINEANRLSKLAQQALRRTMEKYARTCRLLLLSDSLSQIIEPVRSRCLIIRTPRVPNPVVSSIVGDVAIAENADVPLEILDQIVTEAHGDVRRGLILLEMYCMKRKAGGQPELIVPEWERYTDSLCHLIVTEKLTGEVLKKIRDHLYELLVHCVPPREIFRRLLHRLLAEVDGSLIEPIADAAATYEARSQNGTKPIYHLEAFVARFVCIYRDYWADLANET
jgi:replication factor C subunit 3/5